MSEAALVIENLSYSYSGNWSWKKKLALSPFSLTVPVGEAFGFLGHNGAGKTTTIKCILSLVRPSSGTISLFGRDSRKSESRISVGYIPEQPYFYDNITVTELLAMSGRLTGLSGLNLSKRISDNIEKVSLGDKRKAPLRSLSKGLIQRVALAQALINEPRLLILDEPFSGLDPIGRRQFREIFFELKKRGVTLFISSHILSDIELLCDRVSIMVKGALQGVYSIQDIPLMSGAIYELIARTGESTANEIGREADLVTSDGRYHRFEFSSEAAAHTALRRVLSEQGEIQSFQHLRGSLESLFMKVVAPELPEERR